MQPDALPLLRSVKKGQPAFHWFVRVVCTLLLLTPYPKGLLAATSSPTGDPFPPATNATFAPGEVLVGVHRDFLASAEEKEKVSMENLPALAGLSLTAVEILEISDARDAPLFARLRVMPGAEMAAIAYLQADPAIAFAEPNWIAHAAVMDGDGIPTPVLPSDPLFRANHWGMQRIGAPRAWAIGQGAAIRVAVVDSGIDFSHPEFANRLLAGKNYLSPGTLPQDDSGHGTHVAGIIAAALNNGEGVAGLAPKAIIDPLKVLDSSNAGTVSNIAQAIRDAADSGARIINLSLTTSQSSTLLETAVNYAVGKGILLIGAAGNSAPNPVWWPAAYAGVLAVAATDRSDQRAYYSHTGAIDLAAPGGLSNQLIYSTWPAGIKCNSVAPTGYCTAIGTSSSAAFVSGVAALVWGTRPDLSLVQIKNLLLESAFATGAPASDLGSGRVDAQNAIRLALLSDLRLSRSGIDALLLPGAEPFTETVTLSNPSGELIFWKAEVTTGTEWLGIAPAVTPKTASGSLRYGEPLHLPVVISPTLLAPGDHSGSLRLTGNRLNGSSVVTTLPVQVRVRNSLHSLYLSNLARSTPLLWETADGEGKQPLQLNDNSSTGLLLPFTVTLESQPVTTVRVFADGFLTLPANDSPANLSIECAPESTGPQQAIYGWWADLNPALGGNVSIFTSASGAFVVEFFDVPLAGNSAQKVRFQMALFPNGRTHLNYAALPIPGGDVAVGMEISEGLLSTFIACRKGTTVLGSLPVSGQTFVIETTDLR